VTTAFRIRAARLRKDGKPAGVIVVVPVKVSARATERNKIRRQVSEAIRRMAVARTIPPLPAMVLSVHTARIPEGVALEQELLSILRNSGILKR
jgi:ribonuclease P protein component